MASALIVFAERPHGFQWLGIGATVIGYYFFSVVGRREGIIFHRNRGILLINYKKEEAERLTAMLREEVRNMAPAREGEEPPPPHY